MAIQEYVPTDKAWYALRRTLPPWSWERNLEELLGFCRDSKIDEVIVKVDTEEFSHGQVPLQWLQDYLPILQRIASALGENGIYFSINPWITMLHTDRGRDNRAEYPDMQMMIGHDGIETHSCACPLSESWRKHTQELWRLYASTKPKMMWVEDDIRTFNHHPISYGCFCPLHMQKLSERIGRDITRKELVSALLAPGEPHPLRAEWLRFVGDSMVETVGLLSEAVHSVDPTIIMGLMSSGPDTHALEGRQWHKFAKALQGTADTFASRPPLGVYAEGSLRGFYYGASSIRKTRLALPPGAIELTEVENFPFSTFSKSVAFTGMQLMASAALGCQGVTMNLFDHLGNPMANLADFGDMLKRDKDYLNGLASRSTTDALFSGVGLLQREDASFHRRLRPGAGYGELTDDGSSWAYTLEALGIAVTWNTENAPVMALSGQTARALSDEDIQNMLRGGVLCDLSAAKTLIDLGYGEHLGIEITRTDAIHEFGPIAVEALKDPEFGGEQDRYLTATVPGLMSDLELGILKLAPGAKSVSELLDCNRQYVCPMLTVYENQLGGRVAVLPYDITVISECNSFLHPYRRTQLQATLRWLAGKPLPLIVNAGAHALPVRAEEDGYTRLTVFNLSLDSWDKTELLLATNGRTPEKVEFLQSNGVWVTISSDSWQLIDGALKIDHKTEITYHKPGAWCVYWK